MEKRLNIVKLNGMPLTLLGREVKVGDIAPDFTVVTPEMQPFSLNETKGKIRIISVVPSIDTPVCDMQTRWFNEDASKIDNLVILSVSVDLPFALKKYCAAKNINTVKTLSDYKDLDFGMKYGFVIEELRLLSRGAVVIDQNDKVRYVEYVANVEEQPNYTQIMDIVKQL